MVEMTSEGLACARKHWILALGWLGLLLPALAAAGTPLQAQTADPINGGVTFLNTVKCPNGGVGNSQCYAITIQCSGIDGSGAPARGRLHGRIRRSACVTVS